MIGLSRAELRWRDALLASLIPAPRADLPAMSDLELGAFWRRFQATAPPHLRLGLRAAGFAIGGVLPRVLGHSRSLADLDASQRDLVLQRADRLPILAKLLEVAKIVACLAYFADPEVEAIIRGRR